MDRVIRIAGASSSMGDTAEAVPLILQNANPDYIIFDYLSEGQIGILSNMAEQDPTAYPTYFIDFELAKDTPAKLVGAPADCKLATELPRELTFQEGKRLAENPEAASNWGAIFSNKIMVKCP